MKIAGNKNWSEAQRKLVVDLRLQGKTFKEIEQTTKIPIPTLKKFIAKYTKYETVKDLPRTGCPRKTSATIDRHIISEIKKNHFLSAPKLAEEINNTYNIDISPQTIRNRLKDQGYNGRSPAKKPYLKPIHMKRRLEFARKYQNMPLSFWKKVLWTDESKFNLIQSDGAKKVWRKSDEKYKLSCMRGTVKFGGGNVMVWGSMSWKGVGKLAFIDDRMDAQMYVDILGKNLLPSTRKLRMGHDFIFQQDNDPKHTSAKATEFFISKNIEKLEWPAQSPDLNPIEHLWSVLDLMTGDRSFKKKEDLKTKIQEAWDEISPEITKKLVESMPKRLLAVIKANGGPTKY